VEHLRAAPSCNELDGATIDGAEVFDGADCADTNAKGEAMEARPILVSFMGSAAVVDLGLGSGWVWVGLGLEVGLGKDGVNGRRAWAAQRGWIRSVHNLNRTLQQHLRDLLPLPIHWVSLEECPFDALSCRRLGLHGSMGLT
jgi:hypothetical protein